MRRRDGKIITEQSMADQDQEESEKCALHLFKLNQIKLRPREK